MATGGASRSNLDHTECSVCLESMLTKDPRLLTCGHFFCTPCMQTLADKDTITCPICRKETKLSTGGVEKLPKFDQENTGYCGLCLRHNKHINATHTCDKCSNKMICGSCADMHSLFEVLKSHQLKPIKISVEDKSKACQLHNQPLGYFCPVCLTTLCLDCIYINDHKGHENKITDIDQGVSEMKSVIIHFNQELDDKRTGLNKNIRYMKRELKNMDESTKELESIRKTLKEYLNQTDESTQILQGHQQVIRDRISKMRAMDKEVENLEDEFKNITAKATHIYLNETTEYLKKGQVIIKNLEKPVEGFTTAKYVPGNLSGQVGILQFSFQPTKHFAAADLSMKKPELVKEIKAGETVQMAYPQEILAVGDGTVILVNEGSNILQRIDLKGTIVQVYSMGKAVRSAAVQDDCMFVACDDKTVIKLKLDETIPRVTYKPDVNEISRVTATETNVIISNYQSNGKIYEFNTENTKVCVSGLKYPWFVNTENIKEQQIFIVNENQKQINMYNDDWKLIQSIDNREGTLFKNVQGSAITPRGKLLIADRDAHTVSEFKLDGTFVRDILKDPAINKPVGVLYDYPCLWVSEATPALKVFRVD